MGIYERYAPFIRDFIYQNGWESLRAIQVAAGDAIFNTQENVLLTASTASGKTEAAFFPILTLFTEDPPASVGAIYIGPLKALINDQFARLNDLCHEADIPVWHWHGDVSQTHKNKLLKHPSGILQITPESLEALLLHKHSAVPKLFGDLRFIVIDEVHSLMRGDRGGQTLCLIERLSRMAGVTPRRIGLSATIGDPEAAGAFLSAGTGHGTIIPKFETKGQKWRISMEHFYTSGPQASELVSKSALAEKLEKEGGIIDAQVMETLTPGREKSVPPLPVLEAATDTAPPSADPGVGYIFEHSRGKKCLIFCNSREEAEDVTTTLRQYCEAVNEPDRFLIHHGNLSASYRLTAEDAMKEEDAFFSTVTTATLELGIDIGRLERAFQINAPFTVSSFLQRMGRTGRREKPSEMWFVMREEPVEARAMLPESLPWELLQGIALIQLYLEERFVEPPQTDRLPYSLLYHQTMSTLASSGEQTPAALASRILSLNMFRRVTAEDYRLLLRHLLETDHIEQTENGGLIVGLAGERITNNFKFYAVFQENEEYTVRCDSEELGTIVMPPPVGERIAIAGRVWVVEDVDHKRKSIYCQPVKGKVPAYFGQCPGDIHTRILERMRQVLAEEKSYPYLMTNASARLFSARNVAEAAGITRQPLICLGGDLWALFPWLGSYAFLALERFLKLRCGPLLGLKGMDSCRPYYLQFMMKADSSQFFEIVTEAAAQPLDPMSLLYEKEVPVFEKYDDLLPADLVRKGFAYGVLDVKGMLERVLEWKRFIPERIGGGPHSYSDRQQNGLPEQKLLP